MLENEENTEEQPGGNGGTEQKEISQTPPTLPPRDPAIDALLAEMQNVRSQLGNLAKPREEVAPKAISQEEFFANPGLLEERLGERLNKTIAPLLEFKNQYDSERRYGEIKRRIKATNPAIAKVFDSIEGDLDSAIAGADPTQVNENAVLGLVYSIIGSRTLSGGIVGQPAPKPVLPSNSSEVREVPAHLRPSGTRTPPAREEQQKIVLTQEEEKAMRYFGYDPANEEHRKEFKSAADEGLERGQRVTIVGKEIK